MTGLITLTALIVLTEELTRRQSRGPSAHTCGQCGGPVDWRASDPRPGPLGAALCHSCIDLLRRG